MDVREQRERKFNLYSYRRERGLNLPLESLWVYVFLHIRQRESQKMCVGRFWGCVLSEHAQISFCVLVLTEIEQEKKFVGFNCLY